MNFCKHKYFVLYRGDSSDFPGNQELIVEINTMRDLTGCSAHFQFQDYRIDFDSIPADKKLHLVFPASETKKFTLGASDAKLWLTYGSGTDEKTRTVENRIHIVVTNNVNEAYNNDDPQAITVTISGGGGGATVVLDDTVTETSSNGVKSSGIWSWVKSLLPHWLTSDYAEPATVESVENKRDKDDLAVYEKVGVGDDWVWTSDDPDLLNALETNGIKPKRVDDDSVGYHFWYTSTSFGDWTTTGNSWDPSYGVDAHIVKFKYESPVLGKFDVTATATRSYQLRPVSPADYLAKVSQLDEKLDKSGGDVTGTIFLKNNARIYTDDGGISVNNSYGISVYGGGEININEDGSIKFDNPASLVVGSSGGIDKYIDSLAWRTTGNRTLSDYGIADGATKASLAPEYSATSAYSVGAIVYRDGNIYQCKTAIAEGGEAWNAEHWELRKLDDFFTESNSLLTGTIDDRLPIPISEKSAGFTTESYKRFIVTVSGDMTVTLHTPTSGDAEIFECRFNGASLSADASIAFAGATATTMDSNCGTVTAGKVSLMSAFWNGSTWDVNWKVEG